jgi:uncharacterized protein (DUF2141 family)
MMKKLLYLSLISLGLALSVVSCKKDKPNGNEPEVVDSLLLNTKILLEVEGFENLDGNLAIAIYNSSETFNSETEFYREALFTVSADDMSVEIDSLDAGTYAISVLHDEDESGDMEMGGFLNLIPQEGFGFSNNPAIGLSEPSFGECKFEIEEGQSVAVPITLIYM